MKLHHYGILFLTLLLLGLLLGYSLVKSDRVPVAMFSGSVIFLSEVKENMEVLQRVFVTNPELVKDPELRELAEGEGTALFERTLEASITNRIIAESAPEKTRESARDLAGEYLAQAGRENITAFAREGYGWSLEKFRRRILEPQTLREVVKKEKGEGYEEWLREARRAAKVRIWFVLYAWHDGELVPK